MKFDYLPVQTAGVIDLIEETLGDRNHVAAAHTYIAQLNANREATPVPEFSKQEGHAL